MNKFRAWNIRRFLKDDEVAILPNGKLIFLIEREDGEYREMNDLDVKVSFYTGLKDKNGKEIYEMDFYRTADGKDTGIIKYRGSGFYIDWLPPVTFGLRSDLYYVNDGEIIGNVWEDKHD